MFSIITSARTVLTTVMFVGAEILWKYRTKPEIFKYKKTPNKDYTCTKYLIKQSLTLLSARCHWVNAACSYTKGPRPPPQTLPKYK